MGIDRAYSLSQAGAQVGVLSAEEAKARLFLALWPDADACTALQGAAKAGLADAPGRLVPSHKLHLTLAFLGQIDQSVRACVEAAAASLDFRPFELVFDRLGWFPRTQVLWAGCDLSGASQRSHTGPGSPVDRLAASIAQIVTECGVALEKRPFKAHVTLARKIKGPPAIIDIPPIHCEFASFALVASRSGENGVEYHSLAIFPATKNPA